MRDFVTEERISAYVDGELEGDELKLVEDLLAESAEYRQLLAELRSLRASLAEFPSFSLPADFHARVVDQLAASPASDPVSPARRQSTAVPWRTAVLAAASLAAVLAVTFIFSPPASTPLINGPRIIGTTPVRLPVYLQQLPSYVLVYDVTVTPAGQNSKVIQALLKKLGIGVDPALPLNRNLERGLLAIRPSLQVLGATEATPYKNDPATPKSNANDKVEMIYVAAMLTSLDQLGLELEQLSRAGKEVSHLHYDLVSGTKKLGVMNRVHNLACKRYVSDKDIIPSDVGQAFRLAFHAELTSVSVPGSATFPIPTFHAKDAAPAVPAGHVLLIIRNVGAAADKAN